MASVNSGGGVVGDMSSVGAHIGARDALDVTFSSPLTSSAQSGGTTPMRLQDNQVGVGFADMSDAARGTVSADPVADVLRNIRSATGIQQLRRLIHPPGLCTGFADEANTYSTTKAWLRELIFSQPRPQPTDDADATADLSLRYLLPVPHRQAVLALSSKHAWPKRGFQQCEESVAFLKGQHEWCVRERLRQSADHCPDAFAGCMLRTIIRAIGDFISEHPGLNPHIINKLQFADSDLRRLATLIMRFCQYAESLAPYAVSSPTTRIAWNVWEQVYAAHNWRRQMEVYRSDCGPMFPGLHGTVGTDSVSPVVLADSECSHPELLTTRRIPNDSSTNIAASSSATQDQALDRGACAGGCRCCQRISRDGHSGEDRGCG